MGSDQQMMQANTMSSMSNAERVQSKRDVQDALNNPGKFITSGGTGVLRSFAGGAGLVGDILNWGLHTAGTIPDGTHKKVDRFIQENLQGKPVQRFASRFSDKAGKYVQDSTEHFPKTAGATELITDVAGISKAAKMLNFGRKITTMPALTSASKSVRIKYPSGKRVTRPATLLNNASVHKTIPFIAGGGYVAGTEALEDVVSD
jgi:hypothetical protein